jgi:hypothetical protein
LIGLIVEDFGPHDEISTHGPPLGRLSRCLLRYAPNERVRHIGMINTLGSDDPETQARIAVFEQSLEALGWVVGRNLKIEIRQIGGDIDHGRKEVSGTGCACARRLRNDRQRGDRTTSTGYPHYPAHLRSSELRAAFGRLLFKRLASVMSLHGRYCCKSLFEVLSENS